MSNAIKHCKDCNTTVMCHTERRCQREAHGLSAADGSGWPELDSTTLAGTPVDQLENRSLNGNRIGTSDHDKLIMINEVLRRKRDEMPHGKVPVNTVRVWLIVRGLLSPNKTITSKENNQPSHI